MKVSQRVKNFSENIGINFTRQRTINYSTTISLEKIILYIWDTMTGEWDDNLETAQEWFSSLSEDDQVKYIQWFEIQFNDVAVDLEDDEVDEDGMDFEDFLGDENDTTSIDNSISEYLKSSGSDIYNLVYSSVEQFQKTKKAQQEKQKQEQQVKKEPVVDDLAEQVKKLKAENERLNAIIFSMAHHFQVLSEAKHSSSNC